MDVQALTPREFAVAVRDLNFRFRDAKAEGASTEDEASAFDDSDVVILDSDLTTDPSERLDGAEIDDAVETYLTGEIGHDVARLARAHTAAGAIVVVNQSFIRRTFDLTMMRWASAPADAYVTNDDLDNPALWGVEGSTVHAFRPWTWPGLLRLPAAVEAFADSIQPGDVVLDSLGLSEEAKASLTNAQLEALAVQIDDLRQATFSDVAHSSSLGIGGQPKDRVDDEQLRRVAAWGVRRWLDRVVAPAQNVITDLPHLLQDRPWHAKDRADLTAWNSDSRYWDLPDDSGPVPEARNSTLSKILGRPTWNVAELGADRLGSGQRLSPDDPVFCEDTSNFELAQDATDFESDLPGPLTRRFVRVVDGVDYTPRHRLFR